MQQGSKIIAFDLDDVICTRPKGFEDLGVNKYEYCEPVKDMIKLVNKVYNDGHIVKIYTARGMSMFSGDTHKIYNHLYQLTLKQLNDWGIKFHELVMGKLHYDILIDDRAINSNRIKSHTDIDAFL